MRKKSKKSVNIYITKPDYQRLSGLIEITRERNGIEVGHGVGEQHENDAQLAGVARQPLEAALRIPAGEDAELDVVDAGRNAKGLDHRGAGDDQNGSAFVLIL